MGRKYLFTFILLYIAGRATAQVSVKDSSIATALVGVSYGYQIPAGDMATRFGNSSTIQMNIDYKSRSQWLFGVNGSYFFGKHIHETGIFDSIITSDGYVLSQSGEFADVRLYERGFTVSATAGRMFTTKRPNPNSGLVVNFGLGFIQHKIRIETIGNNVPELSKQYKKGYDRLTNGMLLSENIGYMYLSDNRIVNLYFGLEFMQGFTQNRRSYDYDLMKQDTKKRLDMLYGAKISWILPLYKKAPQEYYIY
jgi:hypothetical protein